MAIARLDSLIEHAISRFVIHVLDFLIGVYLLHICEMQRLEQNNCPHSLTGEEEYMTADPYHIAAPYVLRFG